MIVDDVEISNFILKKMIQNINGDFELCDYTNPEWAIRDLIEIAPLIIFLDLNMPVLNGWGFLDIMKNNGYSYPVYILSSSTSEVDRLRSKRYDNVVSFLHKPINTYHLTSILESLQVK